MKIRFIGAKAVLGLFLGIALQSITVLASEQEFNENRDEGNVSSQPMLIIDEITCQGNTSTECSFVTNKYYQQIGDVLNPDEIADAKLRLGTLIQFKSVNIHLEKGYQRNHVVVVFDVNEASNMLYELGGGYDYLKVEPGQESRYGVNSKVTNFNFLGAGKELSLSVSGARDEWKSESLGKGISIDSLGNYTESWAKYSSTNSTNNYLLSLGYYDPHLFGTSHYYLAAGIQFNKYSLENNRSTQILDASQEVAPEIVRWKSEGTQNSHTFVLGRRFGSHSYISLDSVTTNNVSTDQTTYGVSYGWNSEDDTLFPTQGSEFSTRISKFRDDYQVNLHYKKNISVGLNQVLTFGNNITFNEHNYYCTACYLMFRNSVSASIFSRYSHIKAVDKTQGIYAGWYLGFYLGQGNISEEIYNYHFSGINAGYTYQTANMIYRFSLAYNQQENN